MINKYTKECIMSSLTTDTKLKPQSDTTKYTSEC